MEPKLRPSLLKIALAQTLTIPILIVGLILASIGITVSAESHSETVGMILALFGLLVMLGGGITCIILYLNGLYRLCNNLAAKGMNSNGASLFIKSFMIQVAACIFIVLAAIICGNSGNAKLLTIAIALGALISLGATCLSMNGAKHLSTYFRRMSFARTGYMLTIISSAISIPLIFLTPVSFGDFNSATYNPEPSTLTSLLYVFIYIMNTTGFVLVLVGWWNAVGEGSRIDREGLPETTEEARPNK